MKDMSGTRGRFLSFSSSLQSESPEMVVRREEEKYGAEEYFQNLIESGEWELLPFCSAFQTRSPEGQVLSLAEAIQQRIDKLRCFLNDLAREQNHTAYVAILDKINNLEQLKTEVLNRFYREKTTHKIAAEAKGKRFH